MYFSKERLRIGRAERNIVVLEQPRRKKGKKSDLKKREE